MTNYWATEYESKKILFYSMHPGWADTPAVQESMPGFRERFKNNLRSPEQGADTVIWAAISPEAEKHPNGSFFQGLFGIFFLS
jgi:dehydrogenase/reductase SDR family protein 12